MYGPASRIYDGENAPYFMTHFRRPISSIVSTTRKRVLHFLNFVARIMFLVRLRLSVQDEQF